MTLETKPPKRRMALEPVMGVPEIAERWGVSVQTVLREIHAKQLAAFRIGRQFRVRLSEVERYERSAARRAV